MAALAAGAAALLAAMLLVPEGSRWRDVWWSVGVALLLLALVANRLIARAEKARKEAEGSGTQG